jgi:hypothetical protein
MPISRTLAVGLLIGPSQQRLRSVSGTSGRTRHPTSDARNRAAGSLTRSAAAIGATVTQERATSPRSLEDQCAVTMPNDGLDQIGVDDYA